MNHSYSFLIGEESCNGFYTENIPIFDTMDKTICLFDCWSVKESKDYKGVKTQEEVVMSAATSVPASEDNAEEINSFSEYTPSGKFELMVTNKAVFGLFKPGYSYYLTVEEVPMEKQSQYIQDYVNGNNQE